MDGSASARTGDHPAPRLAIMLGSGCGPVSSGRVEEPGRLLRLWSLLNDTGQELHRVTLPADAQARIERQLETVTAELERSVSPVLAGELRRLVGHGGTAPVTLAELRVRHAGVLGWTGGLVIAMLDQLETAPDRLAGSAPPRLGPGGPDEAVGGGVRPG